MVRKFTNDALFEFDTLIDLQVGTVKALQKDFLSGGFSNPNINYFFLQNETEDSLKTHRVYDMEENIIQMSLLGEAKESYDRIFSDYLKEDYSRIIELSPKTNLCRLIRMYAISGIIRPYVICKNDIEKKYVSLLTNNGGIPLMVNTEKEIDLSKYAKVYLSNISDIVNFRHVECICISVLNYGQNFTLIEESNDRILLPHFVMMLGDINKFEIVDPYKTNEVFG